MNTTPTPQTQPTIDDLWTYTMKSIATTAHTERVHPSQLCVCIAPDLKGLFATLDDLWGVRVYSHPFMPKGGVEIRRARIDYGSRVVNDLWEELKTL